MATKKEIFKNWYEKSGRKRYQKLRKTPEGQDQLARAARRFKVTPKGWAYQLHCNARNNSKAKGRPAPTITREWILEELKKGCSVTGLPFVLDGPPRHPLAPSLDRIDCTRSYSEDNTRVVLYGVNVALGTWGLDEYLRIARAALIHRVQSHK